MEISSIISQVCKYFNQDPEDLNCKTRKREIVQTRQICMYFANKFTKKSLADIRKEIGGKDHTTVLHAKRVVNNLMETDCGYRKMILELEEIILKIKIYFPSQIMLQVRLAICQYRNGRYVYTINGVKKVSRLRNLFIPVESIDKALKMMKVEGLDSMNLYMNFRQEMVESKA
jgi:hypothetical protein